VGYKITANSLIYICIFQLRTVSDILPLHLGWLDFVFKMKIDAFCSVLS